MQDRSRLRFLAAAAAAVLGSSCGQSGRLVDPEEPGSIGFPMPGKFSDDDKRAARSLSVANYTALETAAGPFERASLCSAAIGSIIEKFRETSASSNAQMQAFEQLKAYYDRRKASLKPKARDGPDPGRPAASEMPPTPGDQGRIAIACIRTLQASLPS